MEKFLYLLLIGIMILVAACNNSAQQTYQAPAKDSVVAKDTTHKKDSTKPDISNPDAFSEPH